MRLDHIDLSARDVAALQGSLERHCGFETVDTGTVPDVPDLIGAGMANVMPIGEDESNIVVTRIPAHGRSASPPQCRFGLAQDQRRAVSAKHEELTAPRLESGESIGTFKVPDAQWTTFFCALTDGLEIETSHRSRSAQREREREREQS